MKEPWVLIGRYPNLPKCIRNFETPENLAIPKKHPRVAKKSAVLQVPNLYIKPQNTSAAFPGTPGAWHVWMDGTHVGSGISGWFFRVQNLTGTNW